MADRLYVFGPFPYPVRIKALDGSFGGDMPKAGDTYTHVGDPGTVFRIRRTDTNKVVGLYPTQICRHGETKPHEGEVRIDGKWKSWICIPGGIKK